VNRIILFCLALTAASCATKPRWPDKTLVPFEPIQKPVPTAKARPWTHKNYLIRPLATFDVTGRVLLTEDFGSGREAELSPKDLTLGWGTMSHNRYLKQLSLSHSGRFYQWQTQEEGVDKDTVTRSSANMHFIPANDTVAAILKGIRRDDLVRARGYLVQVEAPDGWHWVSSQVRTDTGAGACELIFTEQLEVLLSPPTPPGP